jgi:hypothetical protein
MSLHHSDNKFSVVGHRTAIEFTPPAGDRGGRWNFYADPESFAIRRKKTRQTDRVAGHQVS